MFQDYVLAIHKQLRQDDFPKFKLSPHYTRYLQWKFIEINSKITKEDFAIHRIIGRGGFGEVYGCRKIDTGKFTSSFQCLLLNFKLTTSSLI